MRARSRWRAERENGKSRTIRGKGGKKAHTYNGALKKEIRREPGFTKEVEGEKESDRDCSSWCSLLGAGSVFGSAHCIISISTNLPEQTGKGQTCSASCIIKSFCLRAFSHTARRRPLYPLRSVTQTSPHVPAVGSPLININTHCVSLGGILTYGKAFISPPSSVAGIVSVLCKQWFSVKQSVQPMPRFLPTAH